MASGRELCQTEIMVERDDAEGSRNGARRSPEAGGYARGARKRIAIVETAMQLFGEHGYDGASTRDIAEAAGVNPPAIQYYFGGKEGLFRACATHLTEQFRQTLARVRPPSDPGDPDACLASLCDVLDAIVEHVFDKYERPGWARFIARVRSDDVKRMLDPQIQPARDELDTLCNNLVAGIMGRPASDPVVKLRTLMVLGQFSMLNARHDRALAWIGWPDLRGPRLAVLKSELRAHTRAAFSRSGS